MVVVVVGRAGSADLHARGCGCVRVCGCFASTFPEKAPSRNLRPPNRPRGEGSVCGAGAGVPSRGKSGNRCSSNEPAFFCAMVSATIAWAMPNRIGATLTCTPPVLDVRRRVQDVQ